MSKVYKPQRIGGSIYLCIPSFFFTPNMLEKGVKLRLVEKGNGYTIIRLSELNECEEYNISSEANRKDTLESGASNNVC